MRDSIKKFLDAGDKEGLKKFMDKKIYDGIGVKPTGKKDEELDQLKDATYDMMKELHDNGVVDIDKAFNKFVKMKQEDVICVDGTKNDGFALFIIKSGSVEVKSSIGPSNAILLLRAVKDFSDDIKDKLKKELED